jgi:Mlc titration factor MtfA (ptsG expression regulator)
VKPGVADVWLTRTWAALALLGGAGLGGLAVGWPGATAGGVAGLAVGAWLLESADRRTARRRALLAAPFPEPWRRFLEAATPLYRRLPEETRAGFEQAVRLFMDERRITGIGVAATEEVRLLVAASAATLSAGWTDFEWDQVTEVLVYPQDFDRDYSFDAPELSGQAHGWGTIILSLPSLETSFRDAGDGFHVGYHEFAHVLGMRQSGFGGLPAGLDDTRGGRWQEVTEREMRRLRRGWSVIDDYGAEDPVEFFAVSVEAFFERSLALRQGHGELYGLLRDYFRQDPAAWPDTSS